MPDTWVYVLQMPDCDICNNGTKAAFDCRIPGIGSWANVCWSHFEEYGCKVGLGLGQQLMFEPSE